MTNKNMGKKEEILTVAEKHFMAKGFDGTSVRGIMKEAGAEIGLFYYYFKSKDEAFDIVLDRFFDKYEADFVEILKWGRRNPCRLMEAFFQYVESGTEKFRQKYTDHMHRTVRWAIREHTMEILEPFIRQVVEIQSTYYGVDTPIVPEAATTYLNYGVCSAILHEDKDRYFKIRPEIKKGVSLLMGMPMENQELRIPFRVTMEDVLCCMELAEQLKDYFPGYEKESFEKYVKGTVDAGNGWVVKTDGKVVAMIFYSKEGKSIDYLAVHPDYCRCGLGRRLVETVGAQFPVGTELSVITFRRGDEMGINARKFYEELEFSSGEELMVFDYPCQRLYLTLEDKPVGKHN